MYKRHLKNIVYILLFTGFGCLSMSASADTDSNCDLTGHWSGKIGMSVKQYSPNQPKLKMHGDITMQITKIADNTFRAETVTTFCAPDVGVCTTSDPSVVTLKCVGNNVDASDDNTSIHGVVSNKEMILSDFSAIKLLPGDDGVSIVHNDIRLHKG